MGETVEWRMITTTTLWRKASPLGLLSRPS